ncbi:MAG: flagellar basal body rod protein FlgB [Pseudomonadota bacterium]|jgi:flagellar basal-body rod protein FlgB
MRILDSIFEQTVTGLSKAMDLSWRRGSVITSNIANAETPKYRAAALDFGKELEKAFGSSDAQSLARTNSQHMDIQRDQSARMKADLAGKNKADGNNVDIDLQMAALADNGSDFANAAQLMKHKFGLYRASIRDGRG